MSWLLRGLGLTVSAEDVDLANRLHKYVQVVQVSLHLFPPLTWSSLRLLLEEHLLLQKLEQFLIARGVLIF